MILCRKATSHTSKNTNAAWKCCYAVRGLSSAVVSSLLLAIWMLDPPKMAGNPPCDGETICLKEVTHALINLTSWNAFVCVRFHISGDPQSVQCSGNTTTTKSVLMYMVVYHGPVSRSNFSRKKREERPSCCVHRAIHRPSWCVHRAMHRPSWCVRRTMHGPSCCVHRALHRPSWYVH